MGRRPAASRRRCPARLRGSLRRRPAAVPQHRREPRRTCAASDARPAGDVPSPQDLSHAGVPDAAQHLVSGGCLRGCEEECGACAALGHGLAVRRRDRAAFPVPRNGAEAIRNHRTKYIAPGLRGYYSVAVANRDGSFFLDEYSWHIAVLNCYDSRDQLWRIQESHLVNVYDVPATQARSRPATTSSSAATWSAHSRTPRR